MVVHKTDCIYLFGILAKKRSSLLVDVFTEPRWPRAFESSWPRAAPLGGKAAGLSGVQTLVRCTRSPKLQIML